jgi:hypothetical protein
LFFMGQSRKKQKKRLYVELLIYACSPVRYPLPAATDECINVAQVIAAAPYPKGGTPTEFQDALKYHSPSRVLMIGHWDFKYRQANTFAFTDSTGKIHVIEDTLLARILGVAQLEFAFLNGCCSDTLGRKVIEQGVGYVVCWRTRVADEAAAAFSLAFFKDYKHTGDYIESFKRAALAIQTGQPHCSNERRASS